MKTEYISPEMTIVEIEIEDSILLNSINFASEDWDAEKDEQF